MLLHPCQKNYTEVLTESISELSKRKSLRKQVKKSTEGTVKRNRRDKTPLPNTIKSEMCSNTALKLHVFDAMGVASPSARKLIKRKYLGSKYVYILVKFLRIKYQKVILTKCMHLIRIFKTCRCPPPLYQSLQGCSGENFYQYVIGSLQPPSDLHEHIFSFITLRGLCS